MEYVVGADKFADIIRRYQYYICLVGYKTDSSCFKLIALSLHKLNPQPFRH